MLSSLGYFGDKRLEKGGAFLLQRLCALGPQGISLRTLGGELAGEVRLRRLLDNPQVTTAEMVATARADLLERVAGRHVLALQDTAPRTWSVEDVCGQQSVSARSVVMVMSLVEHGRAHRRPSRRSPDGGRTGPAPRQRPERSGGRRATAILVRDAKAP